MLSSNNIPSPASGRPLAMPRLDMVTGLFYLTTIRRVARRVPRGHQGRRRARRVSSPAEAIMAVDRGAITIQTQIKIRLTDQRPTPEIGREQFPDG